LSALTNVRDGLASFIGCGCLSLHECALVNPDSLAANCGPVACRLPAALRRTPTRS
jgi:MerR family redox-sensitive transcriptional activator SoxR